MTFWLTLNADNISWSTLAVDMARLVNSELFADLEILCNDSVLLFAHRVVLEARAPKFMASIHQHFQQQRRIHLDDMSSQVMLAVLQYCYTDSPDINRECMRRDLLGRIHFLVAQPVVTFARKFGIHRLAAIADVRH